MFFGHFERFPAFLALYVFLYFRSSFKAFGLGGISLKSNSFLLVISAFSVLKTRVIVFFLLIATDVHCTMKVFDGDSRLKLVVMELAVILNPLEVFLEIKYLKVKCIYL
nr:hypothetical protein [Zobellia laminariae]